MRQTLDQSLAARMRWDAIFSSAVPGQRHAFAERAAVQLELPLIPAPLMREMHFGDWKRFRRDRFMKLSRKRWKSSGRDPRNLPCRMRKPAGFEQRIVCGLEQALRHMRQRGDRAGLACYPWRGN